jgi:hypothetical protein
MSDFTSHTKNKEQRTHASAQRRLLGRGATRDGLPKHAAGARSHRPPPASRAPSELGGGHPDLAETVKDRT